MKKQDDDSISKFFQKVAKEPTIEFNENDWSKLEARLEANPATAPFRLSNTKLIIASFAIALLFVGGIYFSLENDNFYEKAEVSNDKSKNEMITERITNDSPLLLNADTAAGPSLTNKNSLGQNRFDVSKKAFGLNVEGEALSKSSDSGLTKIDSSQSTKVDLGKDLMSDELKGNADVDKSEIIGIQNKNESNTLGDISIKEKHLQRYEAQPKGVTNVGTIPIERWVAVPLSSQDSSKQDTVLTEVSKKDFKMDSISSSDESVQKQLNKPLSRWSFLFSFSPDFSSVGLKNYTYPGEAIGLVAHYHLNSRVSLLTGIIKSHKVYESQGSDYKPGNNYWAKRTNNIIPQQIQGICNVLEIPLSVQYKITERKRSSLFVSSGISSYILLNESYQYNYESPNPGADQGWDSAGSTQFLFSMTNISLSYERSLSPHVSVGIEPYVKIPLTNIGWSNVRLYSIGASLTVRYRIQKKKPPLLFMPGRSPD